jgi:hypothetical protein
MTQIPVAGQERPCGLRERKKARTRAAIRRHALRLLREQGCQRTFRAARREVARGSAP